jgi:hypothetical protein
MASTNSSTTCAIGSTKLRVCTEQESSPCVPFPPHDILHAQGLNALITFFHPVQGREKWGSHPIERRQRWGTSGGGLGAAVLDPVDAGWCGGPCDCTMSSHGHGHPLLTIACLASLFAQVKWVYRPCSQLTIGSRQASASRSTCIDS